MRKILQAILDETPKVKTRTFQKLDGVDIHRYDPFEDRFELDPVQYLAVQEGADEKAVGLSLQDGVVFFVCSPNKLMRSLSYLNGKRRKYC